jgi:hypothetical protein
MQTEGRSRAWRPSCRQSVRDHVPVTERKEHVMSEDERSRKRKQHDDNEADVEAHMFEIDDPNDDDPERKRKRGDSEVEDGENADVGRKRK